MPNVPNIWHRATFLFGTVPRFNDTRQYDSSPRSSLNFQSREPQCVSPVHSRGTDNLTQSSQPAELRLLRENSSHRPEVLQQPCVMDLQSRAPTVPANPFGRNKLYHLRFDGHSEGSPLKPRPESQVRTCTIQESHVAGIGVPTRPCASADQAVPDHFPGQWHRSLVPDMN
jgi:hypothetical protein